MKTGLKYSVLALFWALPSIAGVKFTATIDRNPVPLDESVSLQFLIEVDGSKLKAKKPKFYAPGFDEINSYDQTFMQSFYDNGKFGVKNTRKITKVLRPRRKGRLKISKISVIVNGRTYKARDILLRVTTGGGGTPPPRGYGGQLGLRNRSGNKVQPFFLRSEVNKQKLYKGEQAIVSYYMYERTRVFNPEVSKYPDLKGFLREELEMPIVRGNRTRETVVIDGIAYQKTLLLRYAAYPLQTGELKVDSIRMKGDYYPNRGGSTPFSGDPFSNFFNQLKPRTTTKKSEVLKIKVSPLPKANRPSDFSGAVGQFSLSAGIDRYQVSANEPVNLLVKIEGRGNLSPIKELQVAWPNSVELYESKGRSKTDKGGQSQKIFEYLLVPREPGKFTIPGFQFSYFDPKKNNYARLKTKPIILEVGPPKAGTQLLSRKKNETNQNGAAAPAEKKREDIRYLKFNSIKANSKQGLDVLSLGRIFGPVSFVLFLLWILSDQYQLRRNKRLNAKKTVRMRLDSLKSRIEKLRSEGNADFQATDQSLDEMEAITLDAIAERYSVRAKTHSRKELKKVLDLTKDWKQELWSVLEILLEEIEKVRFSGSQGVSDQALDALWQKCQEVLEEIL